MTFGKYSANPDAGNVLFGRGRLYLAKLDSASGLPSEGFRDIGRISSVQLDITTETVDYTSFYNCQPVKDVEIVSDTTLGLSWNADETTAQNLALFFGGEFQEGMAGSGISSPVGTAIAGADIEIFATADLGGYFPIVDAAGNRLLAIDAGATFAFTYGGSNLAASDFEIDLAQGFVRIKPEAALTDGQRLALTDFTPAGGAVDKNLDLVSAFTMGTQSVAAEIKIFSGQDCSQTMLKFYKLLVRPNGQLSLIDNQQSSLPFQATVSANPNGHLVGGLSDYYDIVPLAA